MGGNDSKVLETSQRNLLDFEKNFLFIENYNDPRLQKLKIYEEKGTNALCAEIRFPFEDSNLDIKNELTLAMSLQHKNILQCIGYKIESNETLCSNSKYVRSFLEWYEQDLEIELQDRKKAKLFFEERELFYILESLIEGGIYLQSRTLYHGDICPSKIFLTPDGKVRIAHNGLFADPPTNYLAAWDGKKTCYLSPELMQTLASNVQYPNYNVYKADVFSLGLTILHAATLIDPREAYNYSRYTLSKEYLNELVGIMEQRYSEDFVNGVVKLLTFDPRMRPDFNDIRGFIQDGGREKMKQQFGNQSGFKLNKNNF